jgi:hypothetical protein
MRQQIEEEFSRLTSDVKKDTRQPPDDYRRGAFGRGWRDATERGIVYVDRTLEKLTWQNLGYRFGKSLGDRASPDEVFGVLADMYDRGHRA